MSGRRDPTHESVQPLRGILSRFPGLAPSRHRRTGRDRRRRADHLLQHRQPGKVADGASTTGVLVDQPGALAAFGDFSSSYASPDNTAVPFRAELNPSAASPFTIEFWARPTASDNDDAPISNRFATTNRSGWVFFQREPGLGWNFRMYNGNGSAYGWDYTGGTSTLGQWSHVVAVWTGSGALLYVNGALADDTNGSGLNGVYNPNTSQNLFVGSLIAAGSPMTGRVDEVAFYPSALTGPQIAAHYSTAASPVAGAYRSLVMVDGALLHLQQNPPEVKLTLAGATPTVTFTGILASSPDLVNWNDLVVTSPYTPAGPQPGNLFFRSHR
jgi:hypothetical protein